MLTTDRLLALYDRVAEAADAIPRLRRFVLDLAVRGKLVEQDPTDEPAAELLKRIAKEKARLVKAGEIRKPKPFDPIDEPPFAVPANWAWSRMREVTTDRGQMIPNTRFTYIDVSAINKEAGVIEAPTVLEPAEAPSRARKIVRKGDVIYSCVRPYLLNVAVVEDEIEPAPIASTAFAIINGLGLILPRYIWIVLRSPFMVAAVEETQRGQAYPAINDSDFAVLPFPLPPLAEQHRIVAKVDELMALCDRLEAARAGREAMRDRLTAATLTRLTAPETDAETFPTPPFQSNARFTLQTLTTLTTRPDQIKTLRQTILNLAVRGKLVAQDPTDEPAAELLKRIAIERKALVSAKRIRREEPLAAPEEDAFPHFIPESWLWTKVGTAVLFTEYGTSSKSEPTQSGVPVLTMGNIQDGKVIWGNEKRIPATSEELPTLFVKQYDLLYNRTNSAELVGKTGIYLGSDDRFSFASYLIRLRPSQVNSSPMFLNIAMNAPSFRETQILPLIKQQTGQANVNGTSLKNMLIPLLLIFTQN